MIIIVVFICINTIDNNDSSNDYRTVSCSKLLSVNSCPTRLVSFGFLFVFGCFDLSFHKDPSQI